jgi:hypothetical protein
MLPPFLGSGWFRKIKYVQNCLEMSFLDMFVKILSNVCSPNSTKTASLKIDNPVSSGRKEFKCTGTLALHSSGISELM